MLASERESRRSGGYGVHEDITLFQRGNLFLLAQSFLLVAVTTTCPLVGLAVRTTHTWWRG
jgi:hypothetical protein